MESIQDFEDMLTLLRQHGVRYMIVGGLAFIYHAKPRYTKDMDLWIEPTTENLTRANRALGEFGSPTLMSLEDHDEIVQIGVAPNRIAIGIYGESLRVHGAGSRGGGAVARVTVPDERDGHRAALQGA